MDPADPDWTTTGVIVREAVRLHREVGPGLLEKVYHVVLADRLRDAGLHIEEEVPIQVVVGGRAFEAGYRADVVANRRVLIEIKAEKAHPVHEAQLLTYLRMSGYPVGLLLNFHAHRMRDGIIRRWNVRR